MHEERPDPQVLLSSGPSVPPVCFGNLHYEESMAPSVTVPLRQAVHYTSLLNGVIILERE